jgi:hypothetical protein
MTDPESRVTTVALDTRLHQTLGNWGNDRPLELSEEAQHCHTLIWHCLKQYISIVLSHPVWVLCFSCPRK